MFDMNDADPVEMSKCHINCTEEEYSEYLAEATEGYDDHEERMMKMEKLKIAEEKGLRDVHVYQICECDAVAAYSLEEAKSFYTELTGVKEAELYSDDEVEIIPPEYMVRNSEDNDKLISIQEILDDHWEGEPFIVCSTEW